MTIKIENFLLPAHWAPPLINDDFTGCEDLDEKEINDWLADNPGLYCVGCDDSQEFTRYHDAPNVLACDCLTFSFHRIE